MRVLFLVVFLFTCLQSVISKSGFLDANTRRPRAGYSIGVLFGGDHTIYSKGDGEKLVSFLRENNVNHWFGRDAYELGRRSVFFVPKVVPSPILAGWDGRIEFLSLARDVVDGKPVSSEDISNASSIVMKMYCGQRSLMLTGDKTKKEMKFLINRFNQDADRVKLQSDILLATHHGSDEDFVQDWVTLTKPKHVVLSAGRSSFCHPRSDAFWGYAQSTRLEEIDWHFVRFYGDDITTTNNRLVSVGTEVPHVEEKARGYVHAVTNYSIFVTGSQGDITFRTRGGEKRYTADPTWEERHTAVDEFLANPRLPDNAPIRFKRVCVDDVEGIDLPLLLGNLRTMTSLTELSLQGCDVTEDHVEELSDLIVGVHSLKFLNLKGIKLTSDSRKKIKSAWNNRGLSLDSSSSSEEEDSSSSDEASGSDSGD